ncbi:MAG: hypothetical protein AAGD14_02465 [Planctomycetota bacterium]
MQRGLGHTGRTQNWRALERRERRYLTAAWDDGPEFPCGIVLPLEERSDAGLSPLALVGVAGGAIGLIWSLLQIRPTSDVSSITLGIVLVGSAALLAGSILRLIEASQIPKIGRFLLIDPLRVWDASPDEVTTRDLAGLVKVHATHRLQGGRYTGSLIEVKTASGDAKFLVESKEDARACTAFLHAVAQARPEDGSSISGAQATKIGIRAAATARGQENSRHAPVHVPPPGAAGGGERRRRRPTADEASGPGRLRVLVMAGTLVPALLCAALVLPSLRTGLQKRYLYEQALASTDGFDEIERFLRAFPTDARSSELIALRDDRRFQQAAQQAKEQDGIAPLRAYLAEPTNTRHRKVAAQRIDKWKFQVARAASEKEGTPAALRTFIADPEVKSYKGNARKQISRIYDEALVRFEKATDSKKADPEFVEGFLSVLRKIRRQADPQLLVRFRSAYEPEPSHPSQQLVLALMKLMLIQPADSFREHSIRAREKLLLERMTAPLLEAVGAGLVSIRKAKEDEKPHIEFQYTVSASSTELYVSGGGSYESVEAGRAGKVREVMHKYTVNGFVVFHGGRERRGRFFGGPDQSVPIPDKPKGGDLYSILLDSAFDNLAHHLIRKFGLSAPANDASKK